MSDYKNLLRHSGNYLLATIATKALSFVSIPVYTSLLTVEEYGVFNVFMSTAGLAAVILTLNTEVAIGRYYYDAKNEEDFKRFVGTSVRISLVVFCSLSFLLVILSKPLSLFLGFDTLLTLAIIPVSLYTVMNSVFVQIYQPLLKSRKIAIVSSLQAYISFALSVVAIMLLNEKRYYGQVIGTLLAMLFIANYSVRQINAYCTPCFDKRFIKYILSYSIPNLPYALSSLIIAQFGKLIIGQQQGFEAAGLYSYASNIAALMCIIISVTNSAWIPYFFTYMNIKDYKSINNDYDLIWRVTLIGAGMLSLFNYEIGFFLGRPEYLHQLYLIPILIIGYCFYQWSYVFLRNVGYEKRMIWNAVIVISGGFSNILLNSILINNFKELGVAISFSISYLIMFIIGWIINSFVLKTYTPAMRMFAVPFFFLLIFLSYIIINPTTDISLTAISLKIVIFIVFMIFIMFKWRSKILQLLFSIIGRQSIN